MSAKPPVPVRKVSRTSGDAEAGPGSAPGREPQRVALLGAFRLSAGGRVLALPGASQRIVAFLALRGRCGRSRLAGSLWPDASESAALACLRSGLWRAKRVAPRLIEPSRDSVALADDVEVDISRLVRTARAATAGPLPVEAAAGAVEGAVDDLLPDWNEPWLAEDRERLRQLRMHVLEASAARLASERLYGMALEAALAALRSDVLRESAHRAVIGVHAAEGNVVEAVRAYEECRAVLAGELGIPPSAETSALVRKFRDLGRLGA